MKKGLINNWIPVQSAAQHQKLLSDCTELFTYWSCNGDPFLFFHQGCFSSSVTSIFEAAWAAVIVNKLPFCERFSLSRFCFGGAAQFGFSLFVFNPLSIVLIGLYAFFFFFLGTSPWTSNTSLSPVCTPCQLWHSLPTVRIKSWQNTHRHTQAHGTEDSWEHKPILPDWKRIHTLLCWSFLRRIKTTQAQFI